MSSGRGRGLRGERQRRRRANVVFDAVFVDLQWLLLPRGGALLLLVLLLMPVLLLLLRRHRDGSRHGWPNAAAARRHGRDGRLQGSVGDGHLIDRKSQEWREGKGEKRFYSFFFSWLLLLKVSEKTPVSSRPRVLLT